jgi:hypothetical protein
MSPDAQIEAFPMAILAPKIHDIVPRKPLEVVLIHLRNHSLSVVDMSQSTRPTVKEKHREKGKQTRHLQEVWEVEFKNKRNGHILSRMIRNRQKQRNDPIQMIMIEDQNSVENKSPDSTEDSHPQYDFVSNFPSIPPRL